MSQPYLVASLLWGLLGSSLALTVVAPFFGGWRMWLLAAGGSLVFAVAAILSVGVFVLLLTGFQLILAGVAYRQERAYRA